MARYSPAPLSDSDISLASGWWPLLDAEEAVGAANWDIPDVMNPLTDVEVRVYFELELSTSSVKAITFSLLDATETVIAGGYILEAGNTDKFTKGELLIYARKYGTGTGPKRPAWVRATLWGDTALQQLNQRINTDPWSPTGVRLSVSAGTIVEGRVNIVARKTFAGTL